MASPRRARSLFLSPDKAELLAAKEINNLVNRVEVIPRKTVARQSRPTGTGVEKSAGDSIRNSTTSTISTVDAFCREYRPPSVALHRLSYLNKELPPPPTSETPKQTISRDNAVSRRSTQRNAAVQTTISIQSRYSTRIKPSARSRLSTISSQQRNSEDRLSLRSHISTQDYSIDRDAFRSKRRASITTDHREPSVVGNPSKDDSSRRKSNSISSSIEPHNDDISTAASYEIQDHRHQGADTDPKASQDARDALASTKSKEIISRSISKRKVSMGWTFSDGFLLRSQDELKGTTGSEIRLKGENIALEPMSTPMIPIRWTFNDGIVFRPAESLRKEDGMSAAKSRRMLPIAWSFHDGLIIRPDGSVTNISKATDGNGETVLDGSKLKRRILIGWSFQDGLTIRPDGSITNISKATGESEQIESDGSKSKRMIPIAWSFHDGLTIRPDGSVKIISTATGENEESAQANKPKRIIPVGWTFHEGLVFASTHDSVKSTSDSPDDSSGFETEASSKRLPIAWTFHDGFFLRAG